LPRKRFIYGFSMVMGYGVTYEYAIDNRSDQYKAQFNQIYNPAGVHAEGQAVITPKSDTPYWFVWADLRAESLVVSVPEVEKAR
jgi:hypothetical protein